MLYCYCVALLLFVLSYVLIVCTVPLPPGVNAIAIDKYIYLHTRPPAGNEAGKMLLPSNIKTGLRIQTRPVFPKPRYENTSIAHCPIGVTKRTELKHNF